MTIHRIHTTGNSRPWEHQPSHNLAGDRQWTHGRLLPMIEPKRKWWRLW